MIHWLRESKPRQNEKCNIGFDTQIIDLIWKKNLGDSLRGDYLYINMEK